MRLNFVIGFILVFALGIPMVHAVVYVMQSNFKLTEFQTNALMVVFTMIIVAIPPILSSLRDSHGESKLEKFGEPVGNIFRFLNFKTVSLATVIIIVSIAIAFF